MARAAHAIQKAVRRARACPECHGAGHHEIDLHDVRCDACDGHGTAVPRWAQQRIGQLEATVEQQRARIAELDQDVATATRHVGNPVSYTHLTLPTIYSV